MQTYNNFSSAYPYIISDILTNGTECSPRGMKIKEICGYTFKLNSIEDSLPLQKSRKLNYRFGVLEGLLNVWGQYPKDIILYYNKKMGDFMNEDTQEWDGAYAPRIAQVIDSVYERLKKDPDTRQAVIPIFRSSDATNPSSKDHPCTISLQLLYREGKLNMVATMRSNDILWGAGYDINQFTTIQRALASWLDCPIGWYIHQAGSMHAYLDREEELKKVMFAEQSRLEEYADFQHPTWAMKRDVCKEQLNTLFKYITYYVHSIETKYPDELNSTFKYYYDILTKQRTVNFR